MKRNLIVVFVCYKIPCQIRSHGIKIHELEKLHHSVRLQVPSLRARFYHCHSYVSILKACRKLLKRWIYEFFYTCISSLILHPLHFRIVKSKDLIPAEDYVAWLDLRAVYSIKECIHRFFCRLKVSIVVWRQNDSKSVFL